MSDRRLQIATCAVALLNIIPLGASTLFRTYDAETHLFFADHYRQAWFSLWEPRWFDGMWMVGYPPLVHQLIALLGFITDEETGFRIVQGLALLVFPAAIYALARETLGRRYAGWAALLAAVVPSVYVELYTWGQMPAFVGMVLGIAACAFLARYLRTGRTLALAACVSLTAAATAAHHHGVIFIMPFLMTAIVARWWLVRRSNPRVMLLRPLLAGGLSAAAAAIAILPFWWWLATRYLPQAELPHPTREGIFRSSADAEYFFWGLYGLFVILAPIGLILLLRRRRSWWPLALVITFFAVLGLGTYTPLPGLVFGYGDLWRWLVYDRFAVWAAVLSTLPASVVVERIARSPLRRPGGGVVAVALVLVVARETNLSFFQPLQPPALRDWEEADVVNFLTADDHANWNYMTLGLGEAEMAKVSRLTSARTMDGLYYTARERPELRASGVGSIDSAYWWRTGLEIIPQVLDHPDLWNVKYAVVALPQLQDELKVTGWRPLYSLGSEAAITDTPKLFLQQSAETQSAFRAAYGDGAALAWAAEHGPPAPKSLVSIWQAPANIDIPPLPPAVAPAYPAVLALAWGTLPLLFFVFAVLAVSLDGLSPWAARRPVPTPVPAPAPQRPRSVPTGSRAAELLLGGLASPDTIAGRFFGALVHWAGR